METPVQEKASETILIVDDEPVNRLVLSTVLKKNGYTIVEASNGEDALNCIRTSEPDLVLLDIMMPGLNGFDVLSRIRLDPDTSEIPVILVTALNSGDDILRGITCGADEFLTKPVDLNELLVRLRTILKMRALTNYLKQNEQVSRRVEKLSETLTGSVIFKGTDLAQVLFGLVDLNLRGHTETRGKPEFIYGGLELGSTSHPPTLYTRSDDGRVIAKILESPPDFEGLEALGIWINGVFLSNHQRAAGTIEEYHAMLPPEWKALFGKEINNFLLYRYNGNIIAFVNYHKEIKTFDISWFRHVLHYGKMIILFLRKMTQIEAEFTTLANSLGRLSEIKDETEGRHQRLRQVLELLCGEIRCSGKFIENILEAVNLCDVGKVLVDHTLLAKERPLTEREWSQIKKIPEYSGTILHDLPRLATAKEIASNLYERWDGTGYPEGLKGEEIPYTARLVSVTAVYDALRRKRSYRKPYSHEEALRILRDGDDRLQPGQFDPRILESFLRIAPEVEKLYL
jgi:response regulator RpfG family c-di-GMP phosphodiesterase